MRRLIFLSCLSIAFATIGLLALFEQPYDNNLSYMFVLVGVGIQIRVIVLSAKIEKEQNNSN